MSVHPRPGRPATVGDLHRRQRYEQLLRTELAHIRSDAVAWRNGLVGLLGAVLGFSLVRGRSDIGDLSRSWGIAVGVFLLAALITGTVGVLSLLRAANGWPEPVDADRLLPFAIAEHKEALRSLTFLRRGIALTLLCMAQLVAAVAVTWYGPGDNGQRSPSLHPSSQRAAAASDAWQETGHVEEA